MPPEVGETRTEKKFAFLPTKVYDMKSKQYCWIWLEKFFELEVYKIDWASWAASAKWKVEKRFINSQY